MRTNIVLDPKLASKAMKQSPSVKTKRELVDLALREYVANRERAKVDFGVFFGSDLIAPSDDHKTARR